MNKGAVDSRLLVSWEPGPLRLEIDIDSGNHVYLRSIQPTSPADDARWQPRSTGFSALPLNEIRLTGEGSQFTTSKRQVQGYLANRFEYLYHSVADVEGYKQLEIKTHDKQTGVSAVTRFIAFPSIPVLRATVIVINEGKGAVVLSSVPSLVFGGLTLSTPSWWNDWTVHFAHNAWFREVQWQSRSLPQVGLDEMGVSEASRSNFSISNQGSFSTGGHLPMGAISRVDGNATYLWQIEHNGSWRWEIGDWGKGIYVTAGGPTDQDHAWTKKLNPGESFASPTVALVVERGDIYSAMVPLNKYRRLIRRQHEDNVNLPVIFNDYMNCLMGDPTTQKVLELVGPAAEAGAEVFVIDCGWYSENDDWWETVGEWVPSRRRFPEGLEHLMTKIRAAGLTPGLWIEPEVMGINCAAADEELPSEAFFQRDGKRIVEQGRYQLDFRHPQVVQRLSGVIERLISQFGIGYFKFDYNIDVTQGTDINSNAPGDGLLEHNRAYLRWVASLMDCYPGLVIENCSSGGQRLDYAMLSIHSLQSTSDQTDPVLYACIAAAAPSAVCPEQSASWAYPQPEWSDEINAITMMNAILGRVHLSGHLLKLTSRQRDLVRSGIAVYKSIRSDLRVGDPFWPLGFPSWSASWHALGMDVGRCKYIAVWNTGNTRSHKGGTFDDSKREFKLEGLHGVRCSIELLYPQDYPCSYAWKEVEGRLSVTLPVAPSARLFKVTKLGL